MSQHRCPPVSGPESRPSSAVSPGPASAPSAPSPPSRPVQSQSPGEATLTFACRTHTHTARAPGVRGPAARWEAGRRAPGPRSPRVLTHVPAAPAPLAPALAQIPAPVARPSPQRCCCGNSMAMSICQTASRGRAALARGARGPPGARRRRRAPRPAPRFPPGAAASAAPPIYGERYQGGKWRLRSPRSPGVITFTHTRPHAHTRTHLHTGARRAG